VNQDPDRNEQEQERRDNVGRVQKRYIGDAHAISLTLHAPVAKLCGVDNRFHAVHSFSFSLVQALCSLLTSFCGEELFEDALE